MEEVNDLIEKRVLNSQLNWITFIWRKRNENGQMSPVGKAGDIERFTDGACSHVEDIYR